MRRFILAYGEWHGNVDTESRVFLNIEHIVCLKKVEREEDDANKIIGGTFYIANVEICGHILNYYISKEDYEVLTNAI